MPWATENLDLSTSRVRVRTIEPKDFERIAEAIHDPDGWSGKVWGINTKEKIYEMLHLQLQNRENGECNPFVYFVGDEVAGISRYLHISPLSKRLEIGGTCVAPKWRRTFVNTEVKKILLTHAFESLNATRVEFRVDCANYFSQQNVLRIGAVFEGKIRHWQVRKDGTTPDGLMYSVTSKDWPKIKNRLDFLSAGIYPQSVYLPSEFESENLKMRICKIGDAGSFFDLVTRNSKRLVDSFAQAASVKTLDDARSYLAERIHWASAGTAFYYGVWDKNTNQMIANVHAKNVNWKTRSAELGYWVDAEFHRKGICSQMVKALMEQLLQHHNFRRLVIKTTLTNVASIAVAVKLGFTKEGVFRSEYLTASGELVDTTLFAIVKNSFNKS